MIFITIIHHRLARRCGFRAGNIAASARRYAARM
jgi:hypothetical protein